MQKDAPLRDSLKWFGSIGPSESALFSRSQFWADVRQTCKDESINNKSTKARSKPEYQIINASVTPECKTSRQSFFFPLMRLKTGIRGNKADTAQINGMY